MKNFSFFTVILFVIAMLSPISAMAQNQELWTDVADTEWYDANKTAFDISTPQQLAGVAKLVNEGTTSFAGCTFRLKQDIDLRGKQWVPIGVYNHDGWRIFEGSLDGQGHTIYRLTMDGNDSHQSSFLMGLIGCSEGDITIQDLKLQEVSVNGKDLTIEEFCATGALIAYHSEGILTLHSCHAVSGWVTGGDGNYNTVTGGLVGAIDADIDFLDCSNGLTVTGGEEQDDMSEFGSCTGGLIGATLRSNVIKSCINYGTVIGGSSANNSFTGGLFGLVDRSTVKDCYNTASVTGGEYVAEINVIGGIAGIVFGTSITNCFASGELISGKSGYDFVTGGIVGYLGVDIDKSSSSVSNCLAIQSLIEGKNSDLRSAELQSKALTPSGESVLRPVAPGKQFSSNSLLARGGSSNQDATRIEKREAELRWVPAPVIVTHRIVGYNEDCPLSNNYAYVPGDWNQDEIGTDKLNGAEWSGRMDNAPIDIWDTKIWSIDPVHKLMPKHKWKRTAAVNNPIKFYQVTFNTMGGDDDSQTLFTYCDQPMDEPTAPKKEGYVFNGWFTDNSYQTAWTFGESGDPVTKDMTLVAKWFKRLSMEYSTFDMIATQVANGKPLTPKVTVRWFDNILTEGTDYTIAYFDNIKPGTGHARITGKGNYIGKLDAYFVIIDPMVVFSLDINEVEGITTNPAAGLSWLQKGLHRDLEITADPKYSLANAEVYLNDQLIYPNEEAGYPFTRVIDGLTISLGAITENTVIRIEGIALKTPEEEQTSADLLTQSVKVTPLAGAVRIDAQMATRVQIYRTNGALEAIRPIGEGTTLIPLPAGIYLIRMEERNWKVVIKE